MEKYFSLIGRIIDRLYKIYDIDMRLTVMIIARKENRYVLILINYS